MILTSLDTGQLISHIVREESGYQLFDSIIPVIHDRRDLHACQPVKAALCSKIRNEFGGGQVVEVTFLFKRFLTNYKKLTPIFVDVIAEGKEHERCTVFDDKRLKY